jgi:hypothetical protein
MASDARRPDQDRPDRDKDKYLPTNPPEVNFSLLLSGVIDSIKNDPAQLRNAIYELARVQLQREAWHRNPPMNILEMRRLMLALETAIERVETNSSRQDELAALQSAAELLEPPPAPPPPAMSEREPVRIINQSPIFQRHAARIIDQAPIFMDDPPALPALPPSPQEVTPSAAWRLRSSGAGPVLRGSIVAIVVVALLVVLDRQFDLLGHRTPPAVAAAPTSQKNYAPQPPPLVHAQLPAVPPTTSSGLPLPGVYGVYALSGGQLSELEPLVGRVPDQKVFMSTPVKTPSHTVLPDGRVAFIVYRRDIAANAPDRVAVRVVAKIMRAMTFNTAGQPNTVPLDDQWTIRSASYEFRVAPVSESPEMLMIRPDNPDFVFPAGRYGLVLKGQAYDFTLAGPITEAVQCLERFEAANGGFYTECRTP